jgi:NMD protein affecting ribosome stability and mRNA decay
MGKKRQCVVCGRPKKMGRSERMCADCQFLSLEERRVLRAKRKPKGSVWTVSGGLPSLGR